MVCNISSSVFFSLHSWGVHRHVETCRGHSVHPGGCQPLPHLPQRSVHEGADSWAEGQHGWCQTMVRRSPVHQPNSCQNHAEAGKTPTHLLRPLLFCMFLLLNLVWLSWFLWRSFTSGIKLVQIVTLSKSSGLNYWAFYIRYPLLFISSCIQRLAWTFSNRDPVSVGLVNKSKLGRTNSWRY